MSDSSSTPSSASHILSEVDITKPLVWQLEHDHDKLRLNLEWTLNQSSNKDRSSRHDKHSHDSFSKTTFSGNDLLMDMLSANFRTSHLPQSIMGPKNVVNDLVESLVDVVRAVFYESIDSNSPLRRNHVSMESNAKQGIVSCTINSDAICNEDDCTHGQTKREPEHLASLVEAKAKLSSAIENIVNLFTVITRKDQFVSNENNNNNTAITCNCSDEPSPVEEAVPVSLSDNVTDISTGTEISRENSITSLEWFGEYSEAGRTLKKRPSFDSPVKLPDGPMQTMFYTFHAHGPGSCPDNCIDTVKETNFSSSDNKCQDKTGIGNLETDSSVLIAESQVSDLNLTPPGLQFSKERGQEVRSVLNSQNETSQNKTTDHPACLSTLKENISSNIINAETTLINTGGKDFVVGNHKNGQCDDSDMETISEQIFDSLNDSKTEGFLNEASVVDRHPDCSSAESFIDRSFETNEPSPCVDSNSVSVEESFNTTSNERNGGVLNKGKMCREANKLIDSYNNAPCTLSTNLQERLPYGDASYTYDRKESPDSSTFSGVNGALLEGGEPDLAPEFRFSCEHSRQSEQQQQLQNNYGVKNSLHYVCVNETEREFDSPEQKWKRAPFVSSENNFPETTFYDDSVFEPPENSYIMKTDEYQCRPPKFTSTPSRPETVIGSAYSYSDDKENKYHTSSSHGDLVANACSNRPMHSNSKFRRDMHAARRQSKIPRPVSVRKMPTEEIRYPRTVRSLSKDMRIPDSLFGGHYDSFLQRFSSPQPRRSNSVDRENSFSEKMKYKRRSVSYRNSSVSDSTRTQFRMKKKYDEYVKESKKLEAAMRQKDLCRNSRKERQSVPVPLNKTSTVSSQSNSFTRSSRSNSLTRSRNNSFTRSSGNGSVTSPCGNSQGTETSVPANNLSLTNYRKESFTLPEDSDMESPVLKRKEKPKLTKNVLSCNKYWQKLKLENYKSRIPVLCGNC